MLKQYRIEHCDDFVTLLIYVCYQLLISLCVIWHLLSEALILFSLLFMAFYLLWSNCNTNQQSGDMRRNVILFQILWRASIFILLSYEAKMEMLKKIPTHMDFVGQGRAEKLYQIIIGQLGHILCLRRCRIRISWLWKSAPKGDRRSAS